MNEIETILAGTDLDKMINQLKEKNIKIPEWDTLKKAYEAKLHAIGQESLYPNKKVYDKDDQWVKDVAITRILIGLEKLTTKRMSEFMFTIPPIFTCEEADDDKVIAEQFKALKKILKKAKWRTLNKRRCRTISSECEQATYWYLSPTAKNSIYGFETDFKLKSRVFSPSNGDDLYPLFDETGDMIAFSREFAVEKGGRKIVYFETWTDSKHIIFTQEDGTNWTRVDKNYDERITKIPIIYGWRPQPIWEDADGNKRHEMELLLSRNGDIIAYHAAPVLLLSGDLNGMNPNKDDVNKVYSTDNGGDAKYVSWEQSPESVTLQWDKLWQTYWSEIQLPDLSFENLKGMGAVSGESRKWLMTDPTLKVGDESEIYDDIMDREISIVKEYIGILNPAWKKTISALDVDLEIVPFMIDDEKAKIDVIMTATGGKSVLSQETGVSLAGMAKNPLEELAKIKAEALAAAQLELTEVGPEDEG